MPLTDISSNSRTQCLVINSPTRNSISSQHFVDGKAYSTSVTFQPVDFLFCSDLNKLPQVLIPVVVSPILVLALAPISTPSLMPPETPDPGWTASLVDCTLKLPRRKPCRYISFWCLVSLSLSLELITIFLDQLIAF